MSRDTFVTAEGDSTAAAGADAEALIDRGAELISGAALRVVDTQTGQVGEISPEDFRRNRTRFRLQTAAEADDSRRTEEFGGRGAETAITSALDTVLLGGVSDRMRDAGVQGELRGLREHNEGAALAGDLVGAVGLGAVGGAPLQGLRGASLVGRVLAGVGEGAIGGALEAAGQVSREQALGDPGAAAQELLGQLGLSTLLGGAIGGVAEGVLGGAGALGRGLMRGGQRGAAATRDAVGRLVQRTTGREAAPGVADALLERISQVGGQGLGASDQAFLRSGLSRTAEGRALRAAVDAGESAVDDAVRPLGQQINDLQQVQAATEAFAKGSLKRQSVRRLVSEESLEAAADSIPEMLGAVRRMAHDIAADRALAGGTRLARQLSTIADEAEGTIAGALQTGGRDGATDAFVALDRLKRRFGQEVARTVRGRNSGLIGDQMEAAYEVLRQGLESEHAWGGAAAMQREMNGVWSQLISNGKQFRRRFLADSGTQDGFRRVMTADPSKLKGYLGRTGTAVGELEDQIMRRQADLSDQFASVMLKHVEMGAADSATLASSGDLARALRAQLDDVGTQLGAQNQFREVSESLAERESIFGGVLSPGNLAIAGGAIGLSGDSSGAGAATGLGLGAALSVLKRPDKLLRMMAAMERMRGTFQGRLSSASARVVESAALATGRQTARTRAFAGSLGAMSAVAVAERFDASVEALEATGDPAAFAEALAARTQPIADAAPETATEMMAVAVLAAGYLGSILPPTAMAPAGTLGQPPDSPSDRVPTYQQRQFLMAAQVVDDPLSVLDEAARGTLDRAHVEALQAVYPQLHQQFTQRVVEDVADREKPLPYHGRLRISLLVDAPTDPTLTGAYIARQQQGHRQSAGGSAEGPVVTPGNASPPDLSGTAASPMQELATRRGP